MERKATKGMERKHMKRLIVFFSYILVGMLILSSSGFIFELVVYSNAEENESILNYTICFEKPILREIRLNNKTFTKIHIPDCLSHAMPGNPALPIRPVKLLLPQGKIVSDVDVSYHDFIEIEHDLSSKPIIPQQEPISTAVNEGNISFLMDEDVYNSTDPVFDTVYSNGGIGFCRGFAILTVNLFPVQYIPKTGRLYYFPEIKIKIDLEDDIETLEERNSLLRCNDHDLDIVNSIVLNPDTTDTYSPSFYGILSIGGLCNPADNYEYVIITNEALSDTVGQSYNWSDLLEHRQMYSGLNTTKVAVETIDDCSAYWNDTELFNDSAAHVREFIRDAYINWGTRYVVLGGDWDTGNPDKQIVPTRIFTDYNSVLDPDTDYDDMPCDMYYSHLDGDWRDTAHNCWGGGKNSGVNDHYAELYVGRMTVSNAEQVSNFIKKIIWYDLQADDDFVNKSVFFGGNLGAQFSVTSAEYMEEIRNGGDPNFYQCKGFAEWNDDNPGYKFNVSTRIYHNWGASIPSEYQTVINNNDACLINHLSHGWTTTALDMTNAQLEALTNSKYFFAYSAQCLSGRFTAGDTTEKTLTCMNEDNGAFGLVWNTGYGWGSSSDTNGPNQFLQRHFWDYIFSNSMDNWQIGAAQAYAKDEMSDYVDIPWHYAWCYNWYSSHLFGDPAQKLRVKAYDNSIVLTDENPTNGTSGTSVGNVTLRIDVSDPQGDTMNITFRTNASGAWQDIGSNSSQQNGIYSQTYTFSNYNTTYWWGVNATDTSGSSGWTNNTYHFTTRLIHNVSSPSSFDALTYNKSQINLTWSKGENATHTYIERHTIASWSREEGTMIYNDTGILLYDGDLNSETTYYYQAWGWDDVDKNWSGTNTSAYNTTAANSLPVLSNEAPANNSIDQYLNPVLSVVVSDQDYDLMNVTFWTNATGEWGLIGYNKSSSDGTYTQINSSFNSSSTGYWWSVNCTDGYGWTNETYYFTTMANQAPIIGSENPSNGSTSVSISTSTLSVNINDPEGDTFNWTIKTIPDIGNSSDDNDLDGSKTCIISGLSYSTTYYWFVNVTDTGSGNWTNRAYWFKTKQKSSNSGSYSGSNQNNPPDTPTTPHGPTSGYTNTSYNYSIVTTDPDNDEIRYRFDWGDNTYSGWTDLVESGTQLSLSHNWTLNGTYNIKALAKDENGEESSWSDIFTVTITQQPIIIEDEPVIIVDVPENTSINQAVVFNVSGIYCLEDENLAYHWDFGDGTNGTGTKPSHIYSSPGTYVVKLTVYDSNGIVNITTFEVTIYAESNPTTQDINEDEKSEQAKLFPLWLALFVGGAFVVLIVLLWKKIKSVFSSYDNVNPHKSLSKKIKTYTQQIRSYNVKTSKSSYNVQDANYDHDIQFNTILDETPELREVTVKKSQQDINGINKLIDKLIISKNESINEDKKDK